jgi:hypothetical protein
VGVGRGALRHEPGRCTWELGELIVDVPPRTEPTGFGTCFEVYLDAAWHIFDARKQPPPSAPGRRAGRDAVDVGLITSFGPVTLTELDVRVA